MASRPRDTIARTFTGDFVLPQRVKAEVELDNVLTQSVWFALLHIMSNSGGDPHRYPAGGHMRLEVSTAGASDPIVRFPPQYAAFARYDRAIESWLLQDSGTSSRPSLPDFLDEEGGPQRDVNDAVAMRSMRCVIELKPDVLCPKSKRSETDDESREKNAAYGGDLLDYLKSPYFDPSYNPVAPVASYAVLSRTRPIAICTGNNMTYGFVDVREAAEGGETRPTVRITKKFAWAWRGPAQHTGDAGNPPDVPTQPSDPPLACRPMWSQWEIVIRFVLSFFGKWYIEAMPDTFKETFKRRLEADEDGSCQGNSLAGSKRSRDGDRSNTSKGQGVRGTSKGKPTTKSGSYILRPLVWEDLWAPLRFAVPATHPSEVECTWSRLPGDAELLAQGRMGATYRQQLQGWDVVVKTLPYVLPREDLDEELLAAPTELREELRREELAYRRLEAIQGEFVPRLLWYGEIVERMADALAMEYVGHPVELVTPELAASAKYALKAVHKCGVLHGDIALRNLVVRVADGRVFFVDFGMAIFVDEIGEAEFGCRAAEELHVLRQLLAKRMAKTGAGP
ncbi:hypothetical protein DFJ74DRAFT_374601 [Hyaloraphidium curvatum]|nr:hypothetical protein DFJ74DRAFT_374601 [Hyaloraphidium curvatum]